MTDLTPERRAELREAATSFQLWRFVTSTASDGYPSGGYEEFGDETLALLDAADERDRLAAAVERVRALVYVSDDGTRYGHDGHSPIDGYPECPGCWADGILAMLDGTDE